MSLENGTGTRHACDIARRMTNLVHLTNSVTFSAFAYGYNSVGNRTNRTETLGGSSWTDANGVIVERYLYDIYGHPTVLDAGGNVISGTGQTNRFLFTGREWLADVSLYDYRNRVYSALLGRFLQTDPIRFEAGDANVYRYCANQPGMLTDPEGLDVWTIRDIHGWGHEWFVGQNADGTYWETDMSPAKTGGFRLFGAALNTVADIEFRPISGFDPQKLDLKNFKRMRTYKCSSDVDEAVRRKTTQKANEDDRRYDAAGNNCRDYTDWM